MMNEIQTARKKQSQLADFQNLEKIGQGAFGKVYRAIHKMSKKVFALKKISHRQIQAQNMMEQLNNEIKILKQLNHTHIVRLFDTFTDGEDIYLVMEFVSGQLFTKLTKEGKLDERTAKRMIREVTEAVAYLHEQTPPIIHRDIKPENILLDKNNQVKLADFGWSNFMNTPRKTYCGTFDYLAPQMIDKSGHDERLDIWCLGVLTYELLTGKTPFLVKGPREEAKKIIVKNILQVNITFPNDFPILAKNFILGVLKRRPQERMTIKELLNHQWLDLSKSNRVDQLTLMHKMGGKDGAAINAQDHNIIEALNKRIKELQEELNNAKINERVLADHQKGVTENSEYLLLMKELRKLRGVQQKNLQLLTDNQRYWKQIGQKDKEIIQLKYQIKVLEDNQQNIQKLKNDKKVLLEKVRKLQSDIEGLQIKCRQLSIQNEVSTQTITEKVLKGEKLTLSEAQTAEYFELLLQQMQELENKFKESQRTLQNVLSRDKFSQQKEQELIRLRTEQKTFRDRTRAQLKEEYDELKDKILLQARTELSNERQKWFKEREHLKMFYESQPNNCPSNKMNNIHEDCQLQLKTLRQLQRDRQRAINQLRRRVRQWQQLQQRRRK